MNRSFIVPLWKTMKPLIVKNEFIQNYINGIKNVKI